MVSEVLDEHKTKEEKYSLTFRQGSQQNYFLKFPDYSLTSLACFPFFRMKKNSTIIIYLKK